MSCRIPVTLALLGVVHVADAQIIQSVRRSTPLAWTSLSLGWLQTQSMYDASSNAGWNFASAPQWRATLEVPSGTGASFGVSGSMARVPLIYSGNCSLLTNCDAHANISQIFGLVHLGGTVGFHQVIDIGAGATLFSNFREDGTGTRLGTGKTTSDFTFAIGYGFGYGFSPRTSMMVVQDYGLIIHRRQSGSTNNTAQQAVTRLGIRVGLGERRGRY